MPTVAVKEKLAVLFVMAKEFIRGAPVEIERAVENELLFSLLSGNRLMSSAVAVSVWGPAVAVQ